MHLLHINNKQQIYAIQTSYCKTGVVSTPADPVYWRLLQTRCRSDSELELVLTLLCSCVRIVHNGKRRASLTRSSKTNCNLTKCIQRWILLSEHFSSDVNLFFYRSILKKLQTEVIAPKNNATFRTVRRTAYKQ